MGEGAQLSRQCLHHQKILRHRFGFRYKLNRHKEFCGYCWLPKLQKSLLFPTTRPFSTSEKLVLYKLVRTVVS